jgi:hypothetical protein
MKQKVPTSCYGIERGKLMQIAHKGEAAFDAILDQLNPRSCRRSDPVRGGSIELLSV